jgi:hypothetical protein
MWVQSACSLPGRPLQRHLLSECDLPCIDPCKLSILDDRYDAQEMFQSSLRREQLHTRSITERMHFRACRSQPISWNPSCVEC